MTNSKGITPAQPLTKQFVFDKKKVTTLVINNQPWFLAKDVCDILELTDAVVALRKLDEDEKLISKLYLSGQNRNVTFINESGLYNLIFRSSKPEAKAFRKWVTSEVLPQIFKTGEYKKPTAAALPAPKQDVLDLRDQQYDFWVSNKKLVRKVTHDGVQYYELGAYARSIGAKRKIESVAPNLNRHRTMALKIWLYGMTMPAWFGTQEAINLVTLAQIKKNSNLALPFAQAQQSA